MLREYTHTHRQILQNLQFSLNNFPSFGEIISTLLAFYTVEDFLIVVAKLAVKRPIASHESLVMSERDDDPTRA